MFKDHNKVLFLESKSDAKLWLFLLLQPPEPVHSRNTPDQEIN